MAVADLGRSLFRASPGQSRSRGGGSARFCVRSAAPASDRLAVCGRKPVVSKRSGISLDLRQRLLERAMEANAKRCPLVQSGRSGSLAGADSQAAEIRQTRHRFRLRRALLLRPDCLQGACKQKGPPQPPSPRKAGLSRGTVADLHSKFAGLRIGRPRPALRAPHSSERGTPG
jgi:hypothetical protein